MHWREGLMPKETMYIWIWCHKNGGICEVSLLHLIDFLCPSLNLENSFPLDYCFSRAGEQVQPFFCRCLRFLWGGDNTVHFLPNLAFQPEILTLSPGVQSWRLPVLMFLPRLRHHNLCSFWGLSNCPESFLHLRQAFCATWRNHIGRIYFKPQSG